MILEVTLVQDLNGNSCINRWNYVGSGTPIGITMSQALITAMGGISSDGTGAGFPTDSIFALLAALQSGDVSYVQLLARNIYPSADFYELAYAATLVGLVVSPALSPFTAYGLNTTRVTTAIRRGQKRFAGVAQSFHAGQGQLTTPAYNGLVSLGEAMTDTLSYTEDGNSLTFVPTIVHKEKYTTPSGNDAYRYYSTEAVQMTHIAQGFTWQAKPEVRSQTSRQYGRGM